jgi:hypothetical protein
MENNVMKKIKYFTIILIFVFLIYNQTYSQRIEFTISLLKSSYIEGENIGLIMKLKNITNEDVNIEQPFIKLGAIDIKLKDSEGKLYPYRSWISETSSKFVLGAGMSKLEYLTITNYFAPQTEWPEKAYLPEEKYTLQAAYFVKYDRSEKYFSNELVFSVEKPEGEDLLAFEEYQKGKYEFWVKSNYEGSIKIFENLYRNYPNTVYIPDALRRIFSIYQDRLKDTIHAKVYAEFLLNYPDNTTILSGLGFFLQNLSETDKQKFLDSLKNKNKGTFLEKIINDVKKEVQK